MKAINATTARANLFKIMALVNESSQPITLTNATGVRDFADEVTVDGVRYDGTVKIIRMWAHYYGVR